MKPNQHIAELGPLLLSYGIRQVIICPGSRNAPLTQLFTSNPNFHCSSVVDERSAAYMALGMARQLLEPVVVLTTSGTAVLNLGPAVAEAHHQNIPLVVITADRPPEKIAQFNNQRLDQRAPFYAFSNGFYQFPLPVSYEENLTQVLKNTEALVASALSLPAGPVHINIPLEEPLYEALPPVLKAGDYAPYSPAEGEAFTALDPIDKATKILILAGMGPWDALLLERLSEMVKRCQTVVIAENIANLPNRDFIALPELLLNGTSDTERLTLVPDLVISFGGQVVSKRLKLFLQKLPDLVHKEIAGDVKTSLKLLLDQVRGVDKPISRNLYLDNWKREEQKALGRMKKKVEMLGYGNLSALHALLSAVPSEAVIHLGNSSTIRYSQLLPFRDDLRYYSNRGISGIDGCVSASVGAAMVSDKMHLLIVGDLSFVYDSNGLWNSQFPENLKIAVLNDKGGGIFHLLKGPSDMDFFEEFSVTRHPVSPELLARAFGRTAKRVENQEELEEALPEFFGPNNRFSVLEVDTSGSENSLIFKKFLDNKQ